MALGAYFGSIDIKTRMIRRRFSMTPYTRMTHKFMEHSGFKKKKKKDGIRTSSIVVFLPKNLT